MRLEEGQMALTSLEEYKQLEVELREEIARLESSRIEETTRLQTELVEKDQKLDSDVNGFKEQIKQHSVTICAMEERITKVMKKNKDYQEEIENNKKIIQGKLLDKVHLFKPNSNAVSLYRQWRRTMFYSATIH